MTKPLSYKDLMSQSEETVKDQLVQYINGKLLDASISSSVDSFEATVGNCSFYFNKKYLPFNQQMLDEVLPLFEEKGWEIERRHTYAGEPRWLIFRKDVDFFND